MLLGFLLQISFLFLISINAHAVTFGVTAPAEGAVVSSNRFVLRGTCTAVGAVISSVSPAFSTTCGTDYKWKTTIDPQILPNGPLNIGVSQSNPMTAAIVRHLSRASYRVAVINMDYAGGTAQTVPNLQAGMFTHVRSVADFLRKTSFGKVNISGDVFNLAQPPALSGACWPLLTAALVQAANEGIPLDRYDHYVLITNRTPTFDCAKGYTAGFGFDERTVSHANLPSSLRARVVFSAMQFHVDSPYGEAATYNTSGQPILFYPGAWITSTTVAHELIHSMGHSFHANAYVCSGNQILSQTFGECEHVGTGDSLDIMGTRTIGAMLNPSSALSLGWLPQDSVQTVSTTAEYQIYPYADSIALGPPKTKALRIILPTPIPWRTATQEIRTVTELFIEYRANRGYDEQAANQRRLYLSPGHTQYNPDINGVVIHARTLAADGTPQSLLLPIRSLALDMGTNSEIYKLTDPYLRSGMALNVPLNNISIEVKRGKATTAGSVSSSPEYQQVKVNFH